MWQENVYSRHKIETLTDWSISMWQYNPPFGALTKWKKVLGMCGHNDSLFHLTFTHWSPFQKLCIRLIMLLDHLYLVFLLKDAFGEKSLTKRPILSCYSSIPVTPKVDWVPQGVPPSKEYDYVALNNHHREIWILNTSFWVSVSINNFKLFERA